MVVCIRFEYFMRLSSSLDWESVSLTNTLCKWLIHHLKFVLYIDLILFLHFITWRLDSLVFSSNGRFHHFSFFLSTHLVCLLLLKTKQVIGAESSTRKAPCLSELA